MALQNLGIGRRLPWLDIPERLVLALESWAGSKVVDAWDQSGGFSPGPAARLLLANGSRLFVKAVGPELNPDSPRMHRREAFVSALLPSSSFTPRLLWTHDEGTEGWVLLAFDDIDGRSPAQPWIPDELDQVLSAVVQMAASFTPSPIDVQNIGTSADHFRDEICGWQLLSAERPEGLDDWSKRNLDRLAAIEADAPAMMMGASLVHHDIRADNILLTRDGVVFVDWPHARVGPSWVDLVEMAPSVAIQGGPTPRDLIARQNQQGPDHAVTAAIASFTGYLVRASLKPAPPGLPTLRAFQRAQAEVALEWLKERVALG